MTSDSFWGRGVADWIEFQEPQNLPLYAALLDALALPPNGALLDAGCGAGIATLLALQRGAAVTGFDASADFLDAARSRCPAARFQIGDLREPLPFANGEFDGVLYCNALQFVPNSVESLREAKRVLRSGGRVAIGVFGAPQECESARPMGAVIALLRKSPAGALGPFALSDPDKLAALIRDAGFAAAVAGRVDAPWQYPNREVALRALMSAGPAHQAREIVGEQGVIDALDAAIEPFRDANGSYRFDNVFIFAVGRKP